MALSRNSENKKNTNTRQFAEITKIEVTRAGWVNDSALSFDMIVNGCVQINNCWYRKFVKDGVEGEFISFPQYKASNGKYYNYAYFPITEALQNTIINAISSLL